MSTHWTPIAGAEYAELWQVSTLASEAVWPPDVVGERRPGANELLTHQVAGQRRIVPNRVRAYARAFRKGVAPTTWDALAITADGLTANAIHRLLAIVEAQASVQLLVLLNVSQDALDLGDQGQVRNIRQTLRRHGFEHPDITGPAATMLYRWLNGRGPGDRAGAVLWEDVREVLEIHPELDRWGPTARAVATRGALHSPGLAAMLCYLMCRVDPKGGPAFIERWITDDISSGRDPIHHLRRWLETQHAAAHGTKGGVDVTEKAAMVILARNADLLGERPEKIQWRRNRQARAPEFPRFMLPEESAAAGDRTLGRFIEAQ